MKNFIFTSLFVVFFASQIQAQPYFSSEIINPNLIDAPYRKGDAEWKKEIEYIISLQKKVDKIELEKAKNEVELSPEMVLLSVMPNVKRENNNQLYEFLDRVLETSKVTSRDVKKNWNNKRPYLSDLRINPLVTKEVSNSYPSGHTCASYVLAYVLGQIFPQQNLQFRLRAQEIANHRVLVGMHFPKDLEGGKQLASFVVGALMNDSNFKNDLNAVRKLY